MFIQSSSVARRTQQYLSLLRHLNTSTGPRKIGSSLSENLQKYPLFSSENPRGFSGNDILPRAFVPLHLQCGFRFFSANPVQFCESQDDEFSKVDAMETNETESSAVKNSPQGKTIDLLFREAIGLDEIVELKRLALDVEGISDLPPEEQVKKLKSKLESQCEMINKLRENIDDLEKKIKKLKRKHASEVKTKNQKFPSFVESEKGPIDNNTEGAPSLTSIFSKEQKKSESSIYNNTEEVPSLTSIFSKEQKKSVKAEQKKSVKAEQKKTKKTKMQRKADGVSGSLEHPWPEWVQFLECLNERGYLSKAVNFPGGPLDLRGLSTEELYAFIKFAAVNFANDHPEIPKLLSGKDIRNVVLFGCPSVEIKVVLAAKRLRSFFSIKEDTAGVPINQQNTSNAPSVKVSKEKSLELVDLVRLLCAFGLNAEKNEVSVPDEIKQSVVNLLKELIDFSSTRCE